MLPHRPSFLFAFFSLAVCRAAVSSTNTSSPFSPPPKPPIPPTPPSPQAAVSTPSQSFSTASPNTLSPSFASVSTTSSSTSTISLTTQTTGLSSYTTTSTTSSEASTTRPSTTTISSSSSQTSSPSSSTSSSLPTLSDAAPPTTLIVPDPVPSTSTSSSGDTGPTNDVSSSSATSSTSFWDNKSAVAGTFVTVALASLVLVAVVVYIVFRRHQQRKLERALEEEDFIDGQDIEDPYGTGGVSPAPSMTQRTMLRRAEATVSRDIHFGPNYMDFAGRGTYGLDYPPAAVPLNNAGRAGQGPTYFAAGNVRHQPGASSSVVGHLSSPSNSRQPPGRASVVTPISYDSFYGGIDMGQAI